MKHLLTLVAVASLTITCFSAVLLRSSDVKNELSCGSFRAGNMTFVENNSVLSATAKEQLNTLSIQMMANPGCRIVFKSFPKAWPKNARSEKLTKLRLKNAIDYLLIKGVDTARLRWKLDNSMNERANAVTFQLTISNEGWPVTRTPELGDES